MIKMLQSNKEQREGLARICDNLGTLAAATFIAGIFGRGVFSIFEMIGLLVCFVSLLSVAYLLRKDKK
jgi:hypothetical protein